MLNLAAETTSIHFARSTMRIQPAGGQPIDFSVEIAKTRDEQERGLMFRRHLDDHAGMIFLEEPPLVMTMWI